MKLSRTPLRLLEDTTDFMVGLKRQSDLERDARAYRRSKKAAKPAAVTLKMGDLDDEVMALKNVIKQLVRGRSVGENILALASRAESIKTAVQRKGGIRFKASPSTEQSKLIGGAFQRAFKGL